MPTKKRTSNSFSPTRDGHGIHWHVLLWIITITVFLSTVVMLYAAWAFSGLSQTGLARVDDRAIEQRLERLESRMGAVETTVLEIKAMMQDGQRMTLEDTNGTTTP